MTEDLDFFTNEKPARALVAIYESGEDEIYASIVSDKINTTYSHTTKIVGELHHRGFIQKGSGEDDRTVPLEVTEKGEETGSDLKNLIETLENSPEV